MFSKSGISIFDLQKFKLDKVVSDEVDGIHDLIGYWLSGNPVRSSWWERVSGNVYSACFAFSSGKNPESSFAYIWQRFECWKIQWNEADDTFRATRTLTRELNQNVTYLIDTLASKNMVFLFHYADERKKIPSELLQFDYQTGEPKDFFLPPVGGWPTDLRGIERVTDVDGKIVLFLNFVQNGEHKEVDDGSGYESGFRTGYCIYPANGGTCPTLHVIPFRNYADIAYLVKDDAGSIYSLVTFKEKAMLVRLDDGATVWETTDWKPLVPCLRPDSQGHWRITNLARYQLERQAIALGGPAFDSVSVVPLPEEEEKSLNDLISKIKGTQ